MLTACVLTFSPSSLCTSAAQQYQLDNGGYMDSAWGQNMAGCKCIARSHEVVKPCGSLAALVSQNVVNGSATLFSYHFLGYAPLKAHRAATHPHVPDDASLPQQQKVGPYLSERIIDFCWATSLLPQCRRWLSAGRLTCCFCCKPIHVHEIKVVCRPLCYLCVAGGYIQSMGGYMSPDQTGGYAQAGGAYMAGAQDAGAYGGYAAPAVDAYGNPITYADPAYIPQPEGYQQPIYNPPPQQQ
eukprot:scaffold27013_cov17-Tisochrysis_lutea.AAC.1